VTKVTNGPQKLYTIKYTDGTTMDAEEHEARRWLHGRRGRHDEHGGIHQLHLALLAPQRPEVPHVGGGSAHHVFAMTPNSASAERVFSLLKAMFGDARASSLSDLIEGSLMLKFNKAKRKAEKEMMEQAAGPN
jgi:hypothetical protein